MPFPVSDFFQILSILGNVLFVLYQLIIHFLDQEGTTVAQLRQMHYRVFYQTEAVKLSNGVVIVPSS